MTTRTITFTKAALKTLVKMPVPIAKRIRAKIDQFASNLDEQANNVTKLVGSDRIRLRVGDYRVIINATTLEVEVIAIGVRGGIYE